MEEEEEEDAQMESAERKEHATDGQTGEENVQSDTAAELAGAASERDQAKEASTSGLLPGSPAERRDPFTLFFFFSPYLFQEHGTGSADASQAEGHDSTLVARMSSRTQRQKPTQVCGAFVAETKTQERVNESLLNNVNHDYICFGGFFFCCFFLATKLI